MTAHRHASWWSPAIVLTILVALLAPTPTAHAATLYTVPPVSGSLTRHSISGVYVSGVSSGGYMAGQGPAPRRRPVHGDVFQAAAGVFTAR